MSSFNNKNSLTTMAGLFALAMTATSHADDTEVYFGSSGSTAENPNVVFIIDTSGSMGDDINGKKEDDGGFTGETKLQIVKREFEREITDVSGINAALMRFDNKGKEANKGGYFLEPMKALDDTNKESLISAVNGLTSGGHTPLSETLYEAHQYFIGGSVKFGNDTDPGTNHSGVTIQDDTATVVDESNNTIYASPIVSQCQKNYTVLLTDGLPTYDYDADTEINDTIANGTDTSTTGIDIDNTCDFSNPSNDDNNNGNGNNNANTNSGNDNCLEELAQYMYENDLVPDLTAGDNVSEAEAARTKEKQNVITYTIGFATPKSRTLLETTATAGGGKFYAATDANSLAKAFSDILDEIATYNDSFMAPTVALNAYNGLMHHDELYFAQFSPKGSPKWRGNLKSYVLHYDPDAACTTTLKDADLNDALEPADSGKCEDRYKIKKTARSFWSTDDDGEDVTLGGAAGKLGTNRKIYTYVGATTPAFNKQINLSTNELAKTNTALEHSLFGFTTAETAADTNSAELNTLIDWTRGIDVDDIDGDQDTTESRHDMGDPLHSQPVIVTYRTADEDNANMVLFMGTNEGYLHAIDVSIVDGSNANSGNEIFSFIPQELLPNLKTFRTNASATDHPYGLDGDITAWIKDKNGNGDIESSEGDFVYLYVGMRRGGRNYYALNVTDYNSPKLMWVIKGGVPGDFEELGQTWSRPTLANVMIGTTKTKVLFFGGGYDAATQDVDSDTTTATVDTMGRAVYMVNAKTGERIWWAGPTGSGANLVIDSLTNSIPSDLRVLDTDLDGLHDRIYVGDTKAQLFRFDIEDDGTKTGGKIAGLGGTTVDANRRFFYPPDVVLARKPGQAPYLALNIGTGYRAHPLNDRIEDRFYSLRDYDIFTAPEDYTTVITESDLLDVTTSLVKDSTTYTSLYTNHKGWYLDLGTGGQKVLAPAVTLNSKTIFTTYTPNVETNTGTCSGGGTGLGKMYIVNLYDGNPVVGSAVSSVKNYEDIADISSDDRFGDLNEAGIPPAPGIVFTPGGPAIAFGSQTLPPDSNEIPINKTYWKQVQ